jgi:hypothetical protein
MNHSYSFTITAQEIVDFGNLHERPVTLEHAESAIKRIERKVIGPGLEALKITALREALDSARFHQTIE